MILEQEYPWSDYELIDSGFEEKLERFGYSANDEATYFMLLSNPNLTDGEKEQIKLKIKEIKTDTDYKINKNPNYKNMNTSTAQ